MRYVCAAAIIIALLVSGASPIFGQTGLSIVNYQFISDQRVTRTQWYVTYRATLANSGAARAGITATITSTASTVVVAPGQGTIHFYPVPANSQVTSADTFTILVDREAPFDLSCLKWSFLNPFANAGPNQTATVGSTVTLNGSGSTNPSGTGTLSFSWAFQSRPAASLATLTNPGDVSSSFNVDAPGTYVVNLTVSNGEASDTTAPTNAAIPR